MEIHLSITRGHVMSTTKVVTLGLLLGLGIQMLFAWTPAPVPAPTGTVSAPLTVGNGTQAKAGGDIILNGGGSLSATGLLKAPWLCIGNDCKNAWPIDSLGDHNATMNLNMNSRSITNLSNPVNVTDAATKGYVDANGGGFDCRVCLRQSDSSYNWGPWGCSHFPSDMPIGTPIDSPVFDAGWQDGDHHPLQFRTECR